MRGKHIALIALVLVPTLVLGAGWLWASMREHELRMRERSQLVERAADSIRAAVDESLEELRRREDGREFFLYNHYYVPEDVLALADPVAVSPLAAAPTDERIVGYFQIAPGGVVRTPYDVEGGAMPERASQLREAVASPSFNSLRALVGSAGADWTPDPLPSPTPTPPTVAADPRRREAAPEPQAEPLTVGLEMYTQNQAVAIQAAQQGDVVAANDVQLRGRAVPQIARNMVSVEELQQGVRATTPPSRARSRTAVRVPTPVTSTKPIREEVDYTPMAFVEAGDFLVLYRLVSHRGTSVLQGVLLNRTHIVDAWVPALVGRYGVLDPRPTVVRDASRCARAAVASRILPNVHFCFADDDAAAALTTHRDLRFQIGALIGLFIVAMLGVVAIARAARRSEELVQQKSAFVSAVSHELRTPLTTIRMHAEMLEGGLVSDSRRPQVYGELVQESIRLANLVENVLEFSRIEDGRRPIRRAPGDLVQAVDAAVAAQRAYVERKGFALVFAAPATTMPFAFDRQALEQIMSNLLENAVKYGGGDVNEIRVELEATPAGACVRVLDRGPGIPASERERVFERFHRVERRETAHAPGTGIGLALVRELARAHGGDATAHARDGVGTEIRVVLAAA